MITSGAAMKEAAARIKIKKLLEEAGWRFFDAAGHPANIRLEQTAKLTPNDLETLGQDFQQTPTGFIDFLLLDEKGFPFIVLEAKAEDKNPLIGKEQALVKANKELITRMESKIQATLARVWGEASSEKNVLSEFPTNQISDLPMAAEEPGQYGGKPI